MIFTLEALQAEHGDCLLLHWGGADPNLVLIDGGPPVVWKTDLQPRLEQLRRATQSGDDPLPIKMLMVSHIDDDHIGGLVSMTRDLKDGDENGVALQLDIHDLWHNSFEDALDDGSAPAELATTAGMASAASSASVASSLPFKEEDAAAVIASVDQGRKLRGAANALSIPLNKAFKNKLIQRPAGAAKPKDLGDGLTLDILGPRSDRLKALQEEWKKVVAKKKKGEAGSAQVAAFLDKSIFNLSSIIAIARANQKSILLTGDARGDDICDALEKAKLLKDGKAHFDVFKVPHHGSSRNVTEEFFGEVTADDYVISANGKHDNPDEEMLDMLVAARPTERYTIHLTNPVPHAVKKLKSFQTKAKFKLVVRSETKPSMLIELGDKLPAKLRP